MNLAQTPASRVLHEARSESEILFDYGGLPDIARPPVADDVSIEIELRRA